MNVFWKWALYIMSYLPLYFLILLQNADGLSVAIKGWVKFTNKNQLHLDWNHFYEITLVIFCCIMIIWSFITCVIILTKKKVNNLDIGNYEDAGEGTLNYIATFIVPMISLNISDKNTLLANLALFLILGQLYTMGDLLYLNPVFTLCGYHIIRDKETNQILFSRVPISQLSDKRKSNYNKIQVARLGYSNISIVKKVIENEPKV